MSGPCIFIKKDSGTVKLPKFLRTPSFTEHILLVVCHFVLVLVDFSSLFVTLCSLYVTFYCSSLFFVLLVVSFCLLLVTFCLLLLYFCCCLLIFAYCMLRFARCLWLSYNLVFWKLWLEYLCSLYILLKRRMIYFISWYASYSDKYF